MSGEGNSVKEVPIAKATSPQFMRDEVLKCLKSLRPNPKPVDLTLGKVKQLLQAVEACRGATGKCSFNLGLGVKSQSRPVIAGSYQNWP